MSAELEELVARALAEDLGDGDVTSAATVPEETHADARLIQKQAGVIFGLAPAAEAFRQAGTENFEAAVDEGQWRDEVPAPVATISGPARALLAGERVALNFIAHLSGIATLTARFVAAVAGTGVTILDTRKTTPGLRALEKAAVVAGGGTNHRMGLDDAILIKENHAQIAGGVARAVELAQAAQPGLEIEVECREEAEVEAALDAGAERLLLDNMAPDQLRRAVALRDGAGHPAVLEASGGITLDNVAAVADTGVDSVSIGALTHSAPALDLSLLLEPTGGQPG